MEKGVGQQGWVSGSGTAGYVCVQPIKPNVCGSVQMHSPPTTCATNLCLHHVRALCPHLEYEVEDVHLLHILNHLHHGVDGNESACAAHTGTEGRDNREGTQNKQGLTNLTGNATDKGEECS